MTVIEMNEGAKIPYEAEGNKLNLNDDLIINLAKRESDFPEHIDVCSDKDGNLVIGDGGLYFVAQVDIPAREYTETETESTGESEETTIVREPVAFDINKCTLTLWKLENYIV